MTLTSMMPGPATPIAFNFSFEGLEGSPAHADGAVTFREDLLPNPNLDGGFDLPNPAVSDLQVMVSAAATGNGIFGLADFRRIAWSTNGAALDLNAELVGQTTPGDPWGTRNGTGGDFNLFGAPPRPNGQFFFTLCAGGSGPVDVAAGYTGAGNGQIVDCMGLTSMVIRPELQCAGNCGGDRDVTVDELVFGVNILNGRVLPTRCRALSPDGADIAVDQVLMAVNNALHGCGA
jgi:hypothetical protein